MYSTILLYRDKSCLLCGCADGLSLQTAKNGKIVSEKHLCDSHSLPLMQICVQTAASMRSPLTCDNALLYISHADDSVCLNKVAAVQPPYRIITPVLIRIQNQLFLYYAATNGTHYSIVSYQKSKSWSGQTLYNSPAPLSIKGVCKQENTLFAERSDTNGGYTLLSVCSGGTKQLAPVCLAIQLRAKIKRRPNLPMRPKNLFKSFRALQRHNALPLQRKAFDLHDGKGRAKTFSYRHRACRRPLLCTGSLAIIQPLQRGL